MMTTSTAADDDDDADDGKIHVIYFLLRFNSLFKVIFDYHEIPSLLSEEAFF
jgi:hypothetical protein